MSHRLEDIYYLILYNYKKEFVVLNTIEQLFSKPCCMRYCSVDPTVISISVIHVKTCWVSSLQNIQRICGLYCIWKKNQITQVCVWLILVLLSFLKSKERPHRE